MFRRKNWIRSFGCSAIALSIFLTAHLSTLNAQVSVQDGVVISDELTVKFMLPVVTMPIGEKQATLQHIDASMVQIRNYFGLFRQPVSFLKLIPHAKPEDTLYVNPAGEVMKLHNWSQVFRVKFAEPVDLWRVIGALRKFPEVEYAEPPVQVIHDVTPNDLHKAGNQWYLTKVQAEQAWDITTGSSSLRIALIEGGVASHNDLTGKLVAGETGFSGYHGLQVAGVAGATTNNDLGIASLGWNVLLVPMNSGNGTGIEADIRDAANPSLNHKAKVINCSFKTVIILQDGRTQSYNYSSVAQAITDAQNYGALVIASAGNPPGPNDADVVPYTQWPAAYSGVVAVSATNSSDQFPSGYNYGSHVDVSGPAINILTLDQNNTYTSITIQ